ncbi:MAG: hypothetical protein IPG71_09620 [bacterium]|nr:hypothetical protein [bacterium]
MSKTLIIIAGFSLLALGATVLTTGIEEKAYDSTMENLDAAVDEAERGLGVDSESPEKKKPAMKRAIELNKKMNARMAESQAMLDSLVDAESDALGEYVVTDSTENDY